MFFFGVRALLLNSAIYIMSLIAPILYKVSLIALIYIAYIYRPIGEHPRLSTSQIVLSWLDHAAGTFALHLAAARPWPGPVIRSNAFWNVSAASTALSPTTAA